MLQEVGQCAIDLSCRQSHHISIRSIDPLDSGESDPVLDAVAPRLIHHVAVADVVGDHLLGQRGKGDFRLHAPLYGLSAIGKHDTGNDAV